MAQRKARGPASPRSLPPTPPWAALIFARAEARLELQGPAGALPPAHAADLALVPPCTAFRQVTAEKTTP